MAIRIGHASISENGDAGWDGRAKAGDQTGREVCVTNWYDGGWNVMLICTDPKLAKQAAAYDEAICRDDNYGYDQSQRTTGYIAIVNHNGKVNNGIPSEFDCSSLVASCYKLAGLNISQHCTTRNLRAALLATGKFKAYTDAAHLRTSTYAAVGAIYIREGVHVVMTLDNGPKAEIPVTPAKPAKKEAKPSAELKPEIKPAEHFKKGGKYKTQVGLKIRAGAGTGFEAKVYEQLNKEGKLKDKNKDGILDKGSEIEALEVKSVGKDVWLKTSFGWIAAYYEGSYYIK